MRKHQQKQILKLLQTISLAQSDGLYADCQAGAVSIGNFIESIDGEGTKTVALLEEYCELLYKASKGEIKEKLLRKHMIKIENSVKEELKPNKIEIVFFPYKVSMWDSLESIYLAAKADPNCDAYVVPIPSYELNPNGTLGKMYYDGDQYPSDIPVVDWQTYDIEARHPDLVFIHYAYDDCVNNATIHPGFYSKRLREHCELLVYVPYFVAPGDTVAEYCGYLPGVVYAHHVIVESEAVRQSYIGHYKRFDKELGWKGQYGKAEEKFLVLGSPKFDKVINTRREDCELPEEWKRLIYKPDGSRKKVVFYNTHMFAWINGGEAYFKKLRSVFDLFRSRDDVVLLWRPHPNTELNFRTKRPQWLNEYKAVVEDYMRGGWGIYDESPDLHRAIVWSDAYYGDGSSLVALFRIAVKPLMIQNVDLISGTSEKVCFTFLCSDKQYSWGADCYSNALYQIDNNDLSVEFITRFPQLPLLDPDLFGQPQKIDDTIIFPPYNAENFYKYDIENRELTILKTDIQFEANVGLFVCSVKYGNKIIFVPYRSTFLIVYNTNSETFEKFTLPTDYLIKHFGKLPYKYDYHCNYYYNKACLIGDTLFLSTAHHVIITFDLINHRISEIELNLHDDRVTDMNSDNDLLWIVTAKGALYRYDTVSCELSFERNIYSNDLSICNEKGYYNFIVQKEKLVFFGIYPKNLLIYLDKRTLQNNQETRLDEVSDNGGIGFFQYPNMIENDILVCNKQVGLLKISSDDKVVTKSMERCYKEFSTDEVNEIFSERTYESPLFSLTDMIEHIDLLTEIRTEKCASSPAGSEIYKYVKGLWYAKGC